MAKIQRDKLKNSDGSNLFAFVPLWLRACHKACWAFAPVVGCLLFIGLGCESADSKDIVSQPDKKQWAQEKIKLQTQLAELQNRNEDLENQVKHLLGLGSEIKLEHLAGVEKIAITKRTGLYDKDKDGRKEKLIIYVQPIDREGDTIKAPAVVRVRLLDLDQKPEEMFLEEWFFSPSQLKKLWAGTFMTSYYRLTLDVDENTTRRKELTVKVDVTDYLTGKVHSAQKVIKP